MTHVYIPVNAQGERKILEKKLKEHDDALNALEASAVSLPGLSDNGTTITASEPIVASAGITSTGGTNTFGKTVPGTHTDSTSVGELDNYALPANTSALVFAGNSGDMQLTGMTPGVTNQILEVYNTSAHNLQIYDSNTNSLVANRLKVGTIAGPGGGGSVVVVPGGLCRFRFDGTNWWVYVIWNAVSPAGVSVTGDLGATGHVLASGNLILGGSINLRSGSGTPQSAVVGSVGDIYLRLDGAANTTLYLKTSGAATNTGWTAVSSA